MSSVTHYSAVRPVAMEVACAIVASARAADEDPVSAITGQNLAGQPMGGPCVARHYALAILREIFPQAHVSALAPLVGFRRGIGMGILSNSQRPRSFTQVKLSEARRINRTLRTRYAVAIEQQHRELSHRVGALAIRPQHQEAARKVTPKAPSPSRPIISLGGVSPSKQALRDMITEAMANTARAAAEAAKDDT